MKKRILAGLLLLCLLFVRPVAAEAAEDSENALSEEDTDGWMQAILDELDLEEADTYTTEELSGKITFSELVEEFCTEGLDALDGRELAQWVFDIFFYELSNGKEYFFQMLVFTAVFAVLKRLLDIRSHYISEVSFLMIYAAMMTLLLSSFCLIAEVAQETVAQMISYLSVLVPVYATVLLVSGSAATAGAFYELSFLLMTLLEWAMQVLLVPGIHIFLMLRFLDQLFEEEKLSRMAELLESVIKTALKLGLGAVVGISFVQSLLTPAQDRLTESAVLQSVSAIPGVGNITGSAGEILLSCAILIKNSVGVAALVILLIIALTPFVKILLFTLLYRLLAAILQPVSDRRIVNCIHAASKGSELYLHLIGDGVLMFFLTVTMVTASSSFVF